MVKSPGKQAQQIRTRGWTADQVEEAVSSGQAFKATNLETGGPATRYVHPVTGRSVVIDDRSRKVIHVGGDGFLY